MKIVYLYTALTTVGGADRIIIQKANYLADVMGHEVYIVTDSQAGRAVVFPLSSKVRHIDLGINFDRQYRHGLLLRSLYYFTLMFVYRRKLGRLLERLKADIVISTLGRDLDFLTQLKDGSRKVRESHIAKPYSRNFHLLEQRGFPYRQIARYWRKKQEKGVSRLDALVVLTEHDAGNWASIKQAFVIPNSLPFYPQYGSSCKNKRIISIGRLNEQKGYERLIEAWAIVNRKHPDWEVNIYGEGTEYEMLKSLIEKHKLGKNFKLCQPVRNIQEKYMESSMYVMSSRFEGLPMALLEAMACGLPCVSFNCPHGPAEIITNGEDGLLVENGNIKELAEAICLLIEDESKRIRMGTQAKTNIQRYSQKQIMEKWNNLFHSLTGQS